MRQGRIIKLSCRCNKRTQLLSTTITTMTMRPHTLAYQIMTIHTINLSPFSSQWTCLLVIISNIKISRTKFRTITSVIVSSSLALQLSLARMKSTLSTTCLKMLVLHNSSSISSSSNKCTWMHHRISNNTNLRIIWWCRQMRTWQHTKRESHFSSTIEIIGHRRLVRIGKEILTIYSSIY